jgi:hypothetical protein
LAALLMGMVGGFENGDDVDFVVVADIGVRAIERVLRCDRE